MSDKTTKPLPEHKDVSIAGFAVAPTPDGNGLILTAPAGKVFDLGSNRFQVSPDGKRLEVRVK